MTSQRTRLIFTAGLALMLASLHSAASAEGKPRALRIPLGSEAKKLLRGIELRNSDGSRPDPETIVRQVEPGVASLALVLGDPRNKLLELRPRSKKQQFRVAQRYLTSLTVMNEGPHIDLLGWKHHVSKWQRLRSEDGLTFAAEEVSSEAFPEVTTAEIVAAVQQEVKRWTVGDLDSEARWTDLAQKCKTPTTYPCGVSVNRIELRVQAKIENRWQTVQSIWVDVPMGC